MVIVIYVMFNKTIEIILELLVLKHFFIRNFVNNQSN